MKTATLAIALIISGIGFAASTAFGRSDVADVQSSDSQLHGNIPIRACVVAADGTYRTGDNEMTLIPRSEAKNKACPPRNHTELNEAYQRFAESLAECLQRCGDSDLPCRGRCGLKETH